MHANKFESLYYDPSAVISSPIEKTQVCYFILEGKCYKPDYACPFIHERTAYKLDVIIVDVDIVSHLFICILHIDTIGSLKSNIQDMTQIP